MPPVASVCMPAYRPGRYFDAALGSALQSTLRDIEVIVTDDSGGDLRGSVEAFADPRVRYVANAERIGFAGNHCRALELATGDYIAFLHQDDVWEPRFLEVTVTALREAPRAGMAIVGGWDIGPDGEPMGMRPSRTPGGRMRDPLAVFMRQDFMLLLPSFVTFRAEALTANRRPWPDHNVADLTAYYDVVLAGWEVLHLPEGLAYYRSHDEQASVQLVSHRNSVVALLDSYTFPKPHHEALRRARLARALLARAGAQVRERDGAAARRDLRQARAMDRHVLRGARWWVVLAASLAPGLGPWLHGQWSRLHDPVATSHRG